MVIRVSTREGAVPTGSDLSFNDVGINTVDGKVYTKEGELILRNTLGGEPFIYVSGSNTVTVNSDANNPSYFTGAILKKSRKMNLTDAATCTIRNDSGEVIDFLDGTISVNPDALGGLGVTLHLVSERRPNGGSWIGNPESKRNIEIKNDSESYQTKVSMLEDFQPLEEARFRLWLSSGSMSLVETTEIALNGQSFTTKPYVWMLGAR